MLILYSISLSEFIETIWELPQVEFNEDKVLWKRGYNSRVKGS